MAGRTKRSFGSRQDDKSKYREMCRSQPDIPLSDQDWWLDVTCGGEHNWDVILVRRGREIVASMPYYKAKKGLFHVIAMPQLTLTMGIWIRYPTAQPYVERLSYEREIYLELIDRLPQVDYFNQQFHWNITNWSIFYWHGFRQTTRFTYMLEDLSDMERVHAGFTDDIRSEIRRAEHHLTVFESDDLETFQAVNRKMFTPPAFAMPYSFEVLKSVDEACKQRGCRKILLAADSSGKVWCALYLVWDADCLYYLLGGDNPAAKDTGAHSLLVWHAIQEAARAGKAFDFHGGMHEPIEQIYRSFGAVQKPYFQLSKINGKLFKFAYHLKNAIR